MNHNGDYFRPLGHLPSTLFCVTIEPNEGFAQNSNLCASGGRRLKANTMTIFLTMLVS